MKVKDAFKVNNNGKNAYYCSESEYNEHIKEKQERENMIKLIRSILGYVDGMILPPILIKKINVLNKFYPSEVLSDCFDFNKDTISYWWNLEGKFSNEYGRVSYIMKIIESNINDQYIKWKNKKQIEKKNLINKNKTSIMNIDYEPKKRKSKDISSFLD